ncbi:baseplate J/gp47 family protein [Lysinibacillus sphaericus]|uniref:baseplate J/gp47 family protein n=1 Tax=Lysinibacillus sphaericus TaxID=1421 RepID=UPI003CFE2D33
MTAEIIHQNMLNNTSDNFDKSNGSWTYDIEKSVAIELSKHETKTDNIVDKMNIENLTGEELTRFIFQRTGIKRNLATFANGKVLITVTATTSINVGDLVAADDIFYQFIKAETFSTAGKYYVNVRCVQAGSVGNVPSSAINSFPTTLSNISTVINEVAFDNGYPEETDSSLRQRYYDKLQRPGKAGNKYHYREWAQSVSGVGKVKVFPRWNGALTVKVAVLDVNNGLATPSLIDSVLAHIESERPFGANVTVVTGEELVINISSTFVLNNGYRFEQVKPFISDRLASYFRSIAFEDGLAYISYAQIGRELLDVEGIEDYSNLLLNGSTGNLSIGDTQVPIVGGVINT